MTVEKYLSMSGEERKRYGYPDLPKEPEAIKAVASFFGWEQANNPQYIYSERVVYSEKYDYCGTLDGLIVMDGKRYLVDFKTGNPDSEWDKKAGFPSGRTRARTEHFLQCGAYDQALGEEFKECADVYMVIYIAKSGNLHTFERSDTNAIKEAWIQLYQAVSSINKLDFSNKYQ